MSTMSGFPAPSFVLAQGASNVDPHRILMRRKPKLRGAMKSIRATPSLCTLGRVDNARFNGLLRLQGINTGPNIINIIIGARG